MPKDSNLQIEPTKTFCLCGLPFPAISEEQIIEIMKKSSSSGGQLIVNTPNVNFLRIAESDRNFYNALLNSDLLIPDGMPLIWIAKFLQIPINKRIAGSSLISRLISSLSDFPFKVFYFGGNPGVSRKAHRITNIVRGRSRSVGYLDPGFGDLHELSKEGYIEKINNSKPNVVLVSLPAVKGVSWIEKNRSKINANILIGSGATVNFIAGKLKRAPKFLQNVGLEWLWRIKEEPRLIRRYFLDAIWLFKTLILKILPLVCLNHALKLIIKNNGAEKTTQQLEKQSILIELPAICDCILAEKFSASIGEHLNISCLTLDASKVRFIDSRFLGEMILIKNKYSRCKKTLNIAGASFLFKLLVRLHGVKNFA